MSSPSDSYWLSELQEKWNLSIIEILRLAAKGELKLSVLHLGTGGISRNGQWEVIEGEKYVQLLPDDIKAILKDWDQNFLYRFVRAEYDGCFFTPVGQLGEGKKLEPHMIHVSLGDGRHGIVVAPDEVARVEAKFPELTRWKRAAKVKEHLLEEPAKQDRVVYDIPQKLLAKMCGVTTRTVGNWEKGGCLGEKHGREKHYSRIITAEWLEKTGRFKELESFDKSK